MTCQHGSTVSWGGFSTAGGFLRLLGHFPSCLGVHPSSLNWSSQSGDPYRWIRHGKRVWMQCMPMPLILLPGPVHPRLLLFLSTVLHPIQLSLPTLYLAAPVGHLKTARDRCKAMAFLLAHLRLALLQSVWSGLCNSMYQQNTHSANTGSQWN